MANNTKFKLVGIKQKPATVRQHNSISGLQSQIDEYYQHIANLQKAGQERVNEIKKERQEVSRLVSMANKRLRRLEQRNLTHVPAYQQYLSDGGKYFSIRGKNQNELQAEKARLKRFINSTTSTIRGANDYMKRLANITGMDYKSVKELQQKTPIFFELHSKIEQYLRSVLDIASAIDYEQIWTAINKYVQDANVNLVKNKDNIEKMVKDISDMITAYETPINVDGASVRLRNE